MKSHLLKLLNYLCIFFFFQAEDGIRDGHVTGVQTCALPIYLRRVRHVPRPMGRPAGRPRAPNVAGRARGLRAAETGSPLRVAGCAHARGRGARPLHEAGNAGTDRAARSRTAVSGVRILQWARGEAPEGDHATDSSRLPLCAHGSDCGSVLRAERDARSTSLARVLLSRSTVRHGRPAQRRNEASALETSSAHAVVDGFPDPPPQPVLASGVRIGLYVRPPANHHFAFDGPQPHALTRNDPSPVVADLGARIDQPRSEEHT